MSRRCGRGFANRNQTHFCARHTIQHHFAGKPPVIRAMYREFLAIVRRVGPVKVLAQKSRIAFQVRMALAQLTLGTNHDFERKIIPLNVS